MSSPKKNLTNEESNKIVQWLLRNSKEGKPLRGKMKKPVVKFNSSPRTVSRLWAAAKEQQAAGEVISLRSKKPNTPRKKRVHIDMDLIQNLELHKRATIRKLATGISCSKSTVGRWAIKGLIKAHTSAISPDLTAPNRLLRLRFSIEALEFDRVLNILKFKSIHNTIHIDEKWFYITKSSHRCYLTPAEAEPHRTCKSKIFITKVMFMCAICMPIFTADGTVIFDGKIGIFPFTQQVPALRSSKNRSTNTMETKPIQSITKEVIKSCLINQILPAIRAKWPRCASKMIFIQQDNARHHIKDNDEDLWAASTLEGFDIRLVHQPPNSPDTNVNDLGWFRAIQSIQIQSLSYNVDQLVNAVLESYEELSPQTLNKVFLSLQGCMMEIMKVRGQNCYKIPHLKKDIILRHGAFGSAYIFSERLPISLVRDCITYLIENNNIAGLEGLQNRLGLIIDDWTLVP